MLSTFMKATNNRIQMSEWLEVIEQAGEQPETVPPGFKTSIQIAGEIRKSHSYTLLILRRLVNRGLAKREVFRVISGSRGIYPVPHYKPSKNALN